MKSSLGPFVLFCLSSFPVSAVQAADPVNWAQPPVSCIENLAPSESEDREAKISEIYDASDRHGIPPQVLFGALMQESNFKNLGIAADGGNYSCGIGQLNVREWCFWANGLSAAAKKEIEWPSGGVACDEASLPAEVSRPFYEIARRRAKELKGDQRGPEYYQNISFGEVKAALGVIKAPVLTDGTESAPDITITPELVKERYAAASSFTRYCGDVRKSIRAKSLALKILFDTEVPAPLRKIETYGEKEHFRRVCMRSNGKVYPLHTGWLTAVAMYNAGKKFLPRIASYYRISKEAYEQDAAWAGFNPSKLIEGLHGGGVYNPETKELNYLDLDGKPIEASWFKACVVQQHITRVIRYVTQPGKVIARTLVKEGCGSKLPVPESRQKSSGFYDVP